MLKGVFGFGLLAALLLALLLYSKNDMTNSQMLAQGGRADVTTEEVTFGTGEGFYAEPVAAGEYPGVVMIHEWWGLNDYIRDTARDLAAQGYRVVAVNLFHKPPATTPDEARAQVGALDQKRATTELRAAAAFLRERGANKIASLGWCFGGAQSLHLALSGENLNATVIYYGSNPPVSSEGLKAITWPLLGIYGDKDTGIPVERVEQFTQALTEAGVVHAIHIYPGVGHAFANPSGANYAPEPTRDAWAKTLAFLQEHLK